MTLITTQTRRKEVLEQLMLFKGHTYIQDYIQGKYGIGKKAVERDITLCYKKIAKDYPVETQKVIEKHIALYYDLAKDAKEQYDPKGAASILEKVEKLLGLHKQDVAVQVNNNTLNVNLENLSVEELKDLLNG